MTIPNLGTVVEVNLREAWSHEAHSFTPWLAAHLDTLADQIGIPLELEGQEVPVENFAADILARNSLDGSLVLIENQLESTDHSHLGQIMTYLVGLNAHTVVWIAADFREPHLSAVKWLNDHTIDPFAFFAIKVKAVRIGDSSIAPMFEVLSRPNHWERQLQELTQETLQMTSLGVFRQDFWTAYIDRHPEDRVYGKAYALNHRWHELERIGFVLTLYVAQKRIGVFIRGPRSAPSVETYSRLLPYAEQLSAIAGVDIGSAEQGRFFNSHYSGDYQDKMQWNELIDWLHNTARAYETALREIFEGQ